MRGGMILSFGHSEVEQHLRFYFRLYQLRIQGNKPANYPKNPPFCFLFNILKAVPGKWSQFPFTLMAG